MSFGFLRPLLAIVLTLPLSLAAAPSCDFLFGGAPVFQGKAEEVFGEVFPVIHIAEEHLSKGTFPSSRIDDRNSIYVGVMENGHAYVVAGQYRYDGDFINSGPAKHRKTNLLTAGTVLRIADSDGTLRSRLETYIQTAAPRYSVNCVSGACRLLSDVGHLQLSDGDLKSIFPRNFLRKALLGQLVNESGQPLRVEILVLGDQSISEMTDVMALRSRDESLRAAGLGMISLLIPGLLAMNSALAQ